MSEISTGTLIASLETGCPDNISIKAIRAALLERDSIKAEVEGLTTLLEDAAKKHLVNIGNIARLTARAEKAEAALAAKPKVTREWVADFFEGGLIDTAIAMLKSIGVVVEDGK